jgi:hypothetical protein
MPLPTNRMSYVQDVPGGERRVTLLWFLERDPRTCWERFSGLGDHMDEGGHGRVELVAPFVPTVPGTERFVDQLR